MSMKQTSDHLKKLLDDNENKVIALTGKWGTGKSYLWDSVAKDLRNDATQRIVKASLFGVSNVEVLKRKLLGQAVALHEQADQPQVETSKWDAVKKFGRKHAQKAATINAVVADNLKIWQSVTSVGMQFAIPKVLAGAIIVLDDIERRQATLGVSELMGFVDEYVNDYEVRFVLILNSDKLDAQSAKDCETLREKTISHELVLATTPEEAFDLGLGVETSNYRDRMRQASVRSGISNIRIIRRIIKVAKDLSQGRTLEPAVIERAIPSIVLFTAIHYRGLDDGPTAEFALNIGMSTRRPLLGMGQDEKTEQDEHEDLWTALMEDIGVSYCDAFEPLLLRYLKEGMVDIVELQTIFDGYVNESARLAANEEAMSFRRSAYCDPQMTWAALLAKVATITKSANLLHAANVSEVLSILEQMPNAVQEFTELRNTWIEAFRLRTNGPISQDDVAAMRLHPEIKAEYTRLAQTQVREVTLATLVGRADFDGFEVQEVSLVAQATQQDFVNIISSLDRENFKSFMRAMFRLRNMRPAYGTPLRAGIDAFDAACKELAADGADSRMRWIISTQIKAYAGQPLPPPPPAAASQSGVSSSPLENSLGKG